MNQQHPPRPQLVTTQRELRAILDAWDAGGVEPTGSGPGGAPRQRGHRAVVMTMGALHEGHLELVRQARAQVGESGQVVVTIFVNPLQFGAGEDLDRYPRDLDADMNALATVGADVVFAPTPDVMYPDGDPLVRVTAGPLGATWEGAARPGHFDGVATVVLKLLHLTHPQVAVFGQKDAQQLAVIRRMVRDLDVDVRIVAVPIVREPDGLAMSSRNTYLTPDERQSALALSRAMTAGADAAKEGGGVGHILGAARRVLDDADGVDLDYVALVDASTLAALGPGATGSALLLVAARVGRTRLIDNTALEIRAAGGNA